eukprot:8309134-Pyramimonas_sp.AAC.1
MVSEENIHKLLLCKFEVVASLAGLVLSRSKKIRERDFDFRAAGRPLSRRPGKRYTTVRDCTVRDGGLPGRWRTGKATILDTVAAGKPGVSRRVQHI